MFNLYHVRKNFIKQTEWQLFYLNTHFENIEYSETAVKHLLFPIFDEK